MLREHLCEPEVSAKQRAREELEICLERLDRSKRELQEFAYIASHDLQEPLRKVQSFGNLLMEKHSSSLNEQGRDYLERMVSATKRMSDMIESLLVYSRVVTKGEPFRTVDLTRLVQDVVGNLRAKIQSSGARVEVGRLCEIEADPGQMRQLFQDLIGNGLKFSKADEQPLVRVQCNTANPEYCEITVEDKGIGFDEKYLDRIFAPFQRLHGRSGHHEGVGMGLAVCKRIVERHGGTITAKSALGHGATFFVRIPLKGERKS